jgi:hypothetical protein
MKISGQRYLKVGLVNEKGTKYFNIGNLVLTMFLGPKPEGYICRHYPDQNKHNNNINNLSWSTSRQNTRDINEINPNIIKLNEEIVINLKNDILKGMTTQEASKKYDLEYGHIMNIVEGKYWSDFGPILDRSKLKQLRRRNLTRVEILEIKRLLSIGEKPKLIGEKFDITKHIISKINTGNYHKDVN